MYRAKTKRGSVIEVRGWLGKKLFIDGYPQTQAAYRQDWKTILRRSRIRDLPEWGKALILGLGGGDVIRLLANQHHNLEITAVELESEVVDVAKEYFGICESKNIVIVVQDANAYIQKNLLKYDLVIVDLYSGDDIPNFVSSDKFLSGVAGALKPEGKAIFNYASHSFDENDFVIFQGKLKAVFGSVSRLKTWGHTYYLARN